MAPLPAAVGRAAAAFGLDAERLRPLAGASGSAWGDGDVVLRVGERVDLELMAAAAADGHVPVPRVLDRRAGACCTSTCTRSTSWLTTAVTRRR